MVLEGEVFGFQEARSALAVAWRAAGISQDGPGKSKGGRLSGGLIWGAG